MQEIFFALEFKFRSSINKDAFFFIFAQGQIKLLSVFK